MKRKITLAATMLACAFLSIPAQAELLFSDSIPPEYGEGTLLGSGTTTGGFNTKWSAGNSAGSGSAISTSLGALILPSLEPLAPTPTYGIRVCTSSGRRLSAPFTAQSGNGNSVYCSFLIKVTADTPVERQLVGLRNSTGGGNLAAAVGINASRQLTLLKNSAVQGTHPTVLNQDETYLVVFRYTFLSGADEAAMWLNPTTGTAEESGAGVAPVVTTTGSDQSTLLSLQLASDADASGPLYLDEFRVATTWLEVTPSAGPMVAAKLAFTSLSPVSFAGEIINPVVVQAQTIGGLDVATNNVPVTIALTGGSGTLSGTLTRNTDANGRAVFDDLSINTTGSGKELTASASGSGAGLADAVRGGLWVINNPDAGVVGSPVITQAVASAGSFTLRGKDGAPNGEYQVLSATSVNAPSNSWSSIATTNFDGNGNFAFTDTVSPPGSQRYYRLLSAGTPSGMFQHVGYASVPGPITGGGNTTNVVLATNLASFMAATSDLEPRIVYVEGTITLRTNGNTYLSGNKTIIGLGTNATLIGNLGIFFTEGSTTYSATNIIIRNLHITNPDGYGEDDAITIKNGGRHVWIDHCTMYNTPDELVPITRESDFITISWCKFYYDTFASHNSPHLIGGSETDTTDAGKLHVTLHHNWYATNCNERMPSVRYGRVHVFNNFFNSPGNNYCSRTRLNAEVLVENNHYEGVQNPWELIITSGTTGKLRATGNITNSCTFTTAYNHNTGGTLVLVDGSDELAPEGTDPIGLNPPPYSYTLEPAADLANNVMNNAGAGKGPFAF